jgi:TM2 domain-containing membrane protein YozV
MTKFCTNCGKELQFENAEICPFCGVRIKESPKPQQSKIKSPWIAAIASLIVPGLGQIYCGQIGRGIGTFFTFILFCFMIVTLLGLILAPLFYIWNIADAFNLATRINNEAIAA